MTAACKALTCLAEMFSARTLWAGWTRTGIYPVLFLHIEVLAHKSVTRRSREEKWVTKREVNDVDVFVFTHAERHQVKALKALIDRLIVPARPLQRRTPRPEQSIWAPVSICN